MKFLSGALGLTLTSVVALASANAADMYVPAAPGPGGYKDACCAPTWAGFYVGVNGGGAWSTQNNQLRDFSANTFPGLSPQGGFGGGQIGYNWQSAQFVFGVETDIQGAGINDGVTFTGTSTARYKSALDWFGTVRGRLGYSFGSTLLYGTGGFAYGGVVNDVDYLVGPQNHYRINDTATGYVVGGGLEYKFNPTWSVKLEYQFINLGKNDPVNIGGNPGSPRLLGRTFSSFTGTHVGQDEYNTFRVGLNYSIAPAYVPLK